jgi:hypothetical protein
VIQTETQFSDHAENSLPRIGYALILGLV